MLRSTTGLSSISSGATATFDVALAIGILLNPPGYPSPTNPVQSFTVQDDGYYLLELSYAGGQPTSIDPSMSSYYAVFDLFVDGSLFTTFALSTLGIRESWSQILFLPEGGTLTFKAASFVPFLTNSGSAPSDIVGYVDNLIVTIIRLGPWD